MWGWGSSGKKQASEQQPPQRSHGKPPRSAAANDFGSNFEFDEGEISDAELDDPALLAELARLTAGSPTKSKKAPPVPKKKPVPASVDVEAVINGIDMGSDDVDVNFDESDMNDPELLAALSAIGGGGNEESDSDQGGIVSDEDASPVSDRPREPPRAPQIQVSVAPHSQAKTVQPEQPASQNPQSAPAAPQIDCSRQMEDLPLDVRVQSTDPVVLAKYVQLEKVKALNKKREGDRDGAMQSLRDSKVLEERLQQVTQAIDNNQQPPRHSSSTPRYDELSAAPAKPISHVETSAKVTYTPSSAQEPLEVPDLDVSIASSRNDSRSDSSSISLNTLVQRQTEYRKHALEAKKANNLPRARELLTTAKTMQEHVDALSIGADLPPGYELPPHPATVRSVSGDLDASTPQKLQSASHASPVKQTPTKARVAGTGTPNKTPRAAGSTPLGVVVPESVDLSGALDLQSSPGVSPISGNLLEHLERTLETQIATCTTVAAHYFKQTKKSDALAFHKMKKGLQQDLETIRLLKATPGAQPPAFRYTVLKYEIEQVIPDVALDEMEVQVVKAWDLGTKDVKSDEVESYVVFDVGWPVEDSDAGGSSAEGKGETAVIKKTGAPEFAHSKRIKIVRTRMYQRYLERKKATFEVFHYQRGFLLIGKKTSLGRIQVQMQPLLNKCEIHEIAELADPTNPRRMMGGKLEVRIRLRSPLMKPDVVLKEERWLSIDFSGSPGVATAISPSTPSRVVTSPPAPSPVAKTVSPNTLMVPEPQKSAATTPSTSAAATPKRQPSPQPTASSARTVSPAAPSPASPDSPQGDSPEVEEAESCFLNPDLILSNMVLEKELELLDQQIRALTMARKPIPEDMTDRKMMYPIRMQLVMMRVQGGLSMEEYVAEVKMCSTVTVKWAAIFKKAGKTDLLSQALRRVKWMKDEVDEVEAALAEG
ncbi:Coiled-coil and C2 domain-containing protein 1B [Thoreauomyces humboldtii]|nr:Coiled-coil and C2 domain-containing protein 1B [Thoreauomyces humboldtii]